MLRQKYKGELPKADQMYGHYEYLFLPGLFWSGNSLWCFCARAGPQWKMCGRRICQSTEAVQRRTWLQQCAVRVKTHYTALMCHLLLLYPPPCNYLLRLHQHLGIFLRPSMFCLLQLAWIPSFSRLFSSSQAVYGKDSTGLLHSGSPQTCSGFIKAVVREANSCNRRTQIPLVFILVTSSFNWVFRGHVFVHTKIQGTGSFHLVAPSSSRVFSRRETERGGWAESL